MHPTVDHALVGELKNREDAIFRERHALSIGLRERGLASTLLAELPR